MINIADVFRQADNKETSLIIFNRNAFFVLTFYCQP
jgi:hypothetical protein